MQLEANRIGPWLLLAWLSAGPLGGDEWHTVTSDDGNFVVELPREPAYTESRITLSAGPEGGTPRELELHRFVAEVEQGRGVFTVLYSDYPVSQVAAEGPRTILERVRDGAVSSVRGEIRDETRLTLAGHPGLQVTFEGAPPDAAADTASTASDRVFATFRFYLVGNRLYQVAALQAGGPLDDDVLAKLFDSFRLRQAVAPLPRPGVPPEPPPLTPS